MSGVILHAGQALDEARDARQGPEIRAEAVRTRALAQGRFDAGHLLGNQSRLAPGPARGSQRRAPPFAPRAIPSHDALAAHPQAPGDGPLRLATRGKRPRGLATTNFQSVEISAWCNMSGHAFHRTTEGAEVSLYYARLNKRPPSRSGTRGRRPG